LTDERDLLLDDPWTAGDAAFPAAGRAADKLAFLANFAALAPSILNTEPWRLRIAGDVVRLYADLSRRLPVTDPAGRELTISCGAALLNMRMAAQSFEHELVVTVLPEAARPDLLAQATLKAAPGATADRPLREAITARRTSRGPFADRPLPRTLLDDLVPAARQEGAALSFLEDARGRQRVAQLLAEAERTLLADPDFRDEIAQWIDRRVGEHHDRDSEARQRLGTALAGSAGRTPEPVSRPELLAPMAASAGRAYARPDDALAHQRQRVEEAPALALLTTTGDSPADWLAAGQALQRALLVATQAGACAGYLNAPIEVADLRPRLAQAFDVAERAQVLLRLGYGAQRAPTPRRPVREIVSVTQSFED
jgi:hypothetical protein